MHIRYEGFVYGLVYAVGDQCSYTAFGANGSLIVIGILFYFTAGYTLSAVKAVTLVRNADKLFIVGAVSMKPFHLGFLFVGICASEPELLIAFIASDHTCYSNGS